MKRFWGFVKKEFCHIFRDKRTMLILFGMPIVQVMLFGFVITTDIKDVKIAILDYSKDEITTQITNKILSSGYFVLDDNLLNINNIDKVFKQGKVKEVIIFEKDFGKKLQKESTASLQIISDASDANTANLITNYTQAIITNYMIDYNQSNALPVSIVPQVRMLYNEELKSVNMFVPGIMALILMLISAMMTSITISREKEMGTMEVLLVSPLKPSQIIIGKVAPYLVLSIVNAITILILAYFVFEMPIRGSLILLLIMSMLYIFLALSIGIFISTKANSQQMAMFMSMIGLLMPTMLLSGFIFPIENMPIIIQAIAQVMPPKWFIIIIKNIMLKGTGMAFIWKETLVLSVMILFFITLSVKNFKIRLE